MEPINVKEAQERLPELIDEATSGEDVVIERGDGAAVRLVPVVQPERRPRTFGSARGLIHMSDDFDEPLEDFKDYMS